MAELRGVVVDGAEEFPEVVLPQLGHLFLGLIAGEEDEVAPVVWGESKGVLVVGEQDVVGDVGGLRCPDVLLLNGDFVVGDDRL